MDISSKLAICRKSNSGIMGDIRPTVNDSWISLITYPSADSLTWVYVGVCR